VEPADVVIVEGILVLHMPELLKRFNMKLFVDTDEDVRLARRIRRDTVERGRDVESVITAYTRFVKPAFEAYVLPSKLNADVIIPWREDNPVAVDLIAQHVVTKLSQANLGRIYPNLHIMPPTMQTRGMHTVIRSRDTSREDFVFYADRLIRLVVETALGVLPFDEKTVSTPTGEPYLGVSFTRKVCGVSIIRSGEAMENSLRACIAGIAIGKVLIDEQGEVVYAQLPGDVSERFVLLMDPMIATGRSIAGTLEHLIKDRKIDEAKIHVLSLIAAPEGIHRICTAHPRLKVITSEIDCGLDNDSKVMPGIGDFGDRYFGTSALDCERAGLTPT